MKTGIVIVTRNAVHAGLWKKALEALSRQTLQPDLRLIIDSSSSDQTCAMARRYGWKCKTISSEDFNHGLTRQQALLELRQQGMDNAVFLSQDVILENPRALQNLIAFLGENDITGCYGRQIGGTDDSYDSWQRERCYPPQSCIKGAEDISRLGLMTIFCSDAFSAWKIAPVLDLGGFPETSFGEDALLAAKVIQAGRKIGYCSNAVCRHEHSSSLKALFQRGRMVGLFHRQHPDLLKTFHAENTKFPLKNIRPGICLRLLAKAAGYLTGRCPDTLIPWMIFILTWLLLLPGIVLFDMPQRDVSCRYAPMAEAFAQGDWQFAFHPRVAPFLPVLAGILTGILGCSGITACQLASSLMLSLTVFPLYHGCRRIYNARTAALACLLLPFCFELMRGGYSGLRETSTMFAVVLLFYAGTHLKSAPDGIAGYLLFLLGELILLLTRGEIIIFAAAVFLLAFCWDFLRNKIPWRSLLTASLLLLFLTPQFCYNYRKTGYPVLEVRHARLWVWLGRKYPAVKKLRHPSPQMPLYTE